MPEMRVGREIGRKDLSDGGRLLLLDAGGGVVELRAGDGRSWLYDDGQTAYLAMALFDPRDEREPAGWSARLPGRGGRLAPARRVSRECRRGPLCWALTADQQCERRRRPSPRGDGRRCFVHPLGQGQSHGEANPGHPFSRGWPTATGPTG